MFILIFLTVSAGFAGWMLFLWAVKSGQYDDMEGPKYRMLDEDEDELEIRTPGRKSSPSEAALENQKRKVPGNGKDHES